MLAMKGPLLVPGHLTEATVPPPLGEASQRELRFCVPVKLHNTDAILLTSFLCWVPPKNK